MISLVLPTSQRAEALRATLPSYLRVQGVDQIIVVDDGSTDGTADVLRSQTDSRIEVVRHETRRGQPAARNAGVAAATQEFVLFGEDDCRVPDDYGVILAEEAERHDAAIVGAPWIHAKAGLEGVVEAERRAQAVTRITIDSHPSTFPVEATQTPFLPALVLVRANVFGSLQFDLGYRGNAYREETDFFVSAVRAGSTALLTPRTCSYQAGQWTGGARMSRGLYEYWAFRNNARFLRKHGPWLKAHGHIDSLLGAQMGFARARIQSAVVAPIRRRLG